MLVEKSSIPVDRSDGSSMAVRWQFDLLAWSIGPAGRW